VLIGAGEEAQLVLEADGWGEAAPAGFDVGFELGAEAARGFELVDGGQPGAAAGAVHALAQAAEALDDLGGRLDRAQRAVTDGDQHVHLDVPADRAVLGADLAPTGRRDGQEGAADLPGQPVLLRLVHRGQRLAHDLFPTSRVPRSELTTLPGEQRTPEATRRLVEAGCGGNPAGPKETSQLTALYARSGVGLP
jgi:hypothetical protein